MSRVIVVGYDDKEPAKLALERAIEEAQRHGDKLEVVAVYEMPLDPRGPRNYGTLDDGPIVHDFQAPDSITEALEHAREQVEGRGVRASYVWAPGMPATILVEAAKSAKARMIVIGEHHEGFFGSLFHGMSTEAEVEREAGCPVVVVREDDDS